MMVLVAGAGAGIHKRFKAFDPGAVMMVPPSLDEWLPETQKILAAEVSDLLANADAIDQAEDTRFGKDKRGDELPAELARRESRLVKLAQAREQLEADAKAQRNFTDPDSRIMKTADGSFHYCYTGQAVVDADYQAIVVNELNNVAVDVEQLQPMIEQARTTMGALPGEVLADAGYCSNKNLEYVQTIEDDSGGQTEFFIATGRQKPVRRSMPDAKRSWNRCSVKSIPGKANTFSFAGWNKPNTSGTSSPATTIS